MTPEEIKQQILKSTNELARPNREEKKAELDSSDPQAMYVLGCRYYVGDNVDENHEEAVKWYRAAADQGHSGAQAALGGCYNDGEGVEQNYEEAVKWFRAAADQGHSDAQDFLGNRYAFGQGVEQNDEEAVRWYRASAEQGNSNAQDTLGDCYREGKGVQQNDEEAVRWYRASAEQGDSQGQHSLGECYREGWGVAQDLEEAAKWYRAAAEQENDEAKASLQALGQGTTSSSPAQPPPVPGQDPEVVETNVKTVEPSIPISSPVQPPPAPVRALDQHIPANTQPTSLGAVMHLLGFAGLFFPFGNIFAPLILWLVKRGDSSYIDSVGKEVINFQISYTIYLTVSLILCKVWIGLILFPVIGLMWMIFMVVATVKAGKGGEYRYPLTFRFLK